MASTAPRDAEATKHRLLSAATTEFAHYGIAGARVDRIASDARSNKAQIYHYFSSKDGLFDAVFGLLVEQVVAEAPLDADDLPGYAGRLFDGYEQHPDIGRLATWYRLERGPESPPIQAIIDANATKTDAIREAQRRGTLPSDYSPEEILGLVMHTAALWVSQPAEYDHVVREISTARRREVVVSAVRALFGTRGDAA